MRSAPFLIALFATVAYGRPGWADGPPVVPSAADARMPVVMLGTMTPAGDVPSPTPLHRPLAGGPGSERNVAERALELDATLRDAVQDLGFTLSIADSAPPPGGMRDEDLIARAAHSGAGAPDDAGTWVVSPRIEAAGGGRYVLRLVAVAPRGHELRVRVETVPADSVNVRGLVMLRDLLSSNAATRATVERDREQAAKGTSEGIMSPLRSQGRAVLAVNSGLFGAFAAFSLQRSSSAGSNADDPRVLYPLLALGTGMGVGGALLVADEWDVTTGDAWYLAAGGWWGAASAFLLAAGAQVQPFEDRYAIGVGGGLVGVSLATFALTRGQMDDGDAMLTHSGGALGLLLGGATDLLFQGKTTADVTPYAGMGYGTALGVLAAGALATRVSTSPSRVLLIDLGLGGGALLGAAAASPLIFQNVTEAHTRGWLSATLAGSVLGGVGAFWLTRDGDRRPAAWLPGAPTAGIIGASPTPAGSTPIYGVGWYGKL
ncbi:MAG TPA: hypothetical protein VKU41_24570 [Polyangiaceae bacterium]|nr:hypothetical protein [Polyangiaceae bacterium]